MAGDAERPSRGRREPPDPPMLPRNPAREPGLWFWPLITFGLIIVLLAFLLPMLLRIAAP